MTAVELVEGAVLLRFDGDDDTANRAAVAYAQQLRASQPPGLLEAIPAARSVLVLSNQRLPLPSGGEGRGEGRSKRVTIPMRYQDAQIRAVHQPARYRVAFLGFAPGFPYLLGLPRELHRPRLATPRTRTPTGSVAIAQQYCGIYPAELPGGWNIIGQTGVRLFDGHTTLLEPGDEVQFEEGDAPAPPPLPVAEPVLPLRFLTPWRGASVQGAPSHGRGHLGIPAGGAFDLVSLEAGNRRVGNPAHAPALEIVLQAPEIELTRDARVCVIGDMEESVPRVRLKAGTRLRLGRVTSGARAWLCVESEDAEEPVDVPPVPIASGQLTLRIAEGPQAEQFTAEAQRTLVEAEWRVSPQSDRRGVRLQGPRLEGSAEIPPEGTAPGAVQVPGSGQPIILGPDRPVTGGYPKIATVVPEDLRLLAQARPGTVIRLRPCE